MSTIKKDSRVVTCSAGNHAQGVAYACSKMGLFADVFMPNITSGQKVSKVASFGGANISLFLEGKNFDESYDIALNYSKNHNYSFIIFKNDFDV